MIQFHSNVFLFLEEYCIIYEQTSNLFGEKHLNPVSLLILIKFVFYSSVEGWSYNVVVDFSNTIIL